MGGTRSDLAEGALVIPGECDLRESVTRAIGLSKL